MLRCEGLPVSGPVRRRENTMFRATEDTTTYCV